MKKSIFLLLPLFASTVLAQGQSSGLGSLKLPSHAREAALAAATVADPSSPSSFLLNPALLEYSQSPEFAVSHQEWIEDVQSNSLMTVIPVSFGVFGFSVSSTSIGGIELRDQPGPPRGTFNSRYATAGISAAAAFGQSVRAGVSVKYLYEKIFVDEADGWGVDLGLAYQTEIEGLSFGASLLNMGSMGELRSSSTRLPTSLVAGAAFQTGIHEKITFRAMTSFQRYLAISSTHASIGLELDYSRFFLARAGYQTGYSTRGISAGIGIVSLPFLLDYSFTPFSFSLGNAHLLSLGIRL
jgi:hypothetical protein